jgi:succinate dehydrogenase / fumarate reductase cytochrome b subunit
MHSFGSIAWSSVGKKVITGLTGLALMGFIIAHLIGNFTLLLGPEAFNGYAHFLVTAMHGWLIYIFEAVIIVIFLFHIVSAVSVAIVDKMKARDQGYKFGKNAGGKSRKSFASVSMIYTGVLVGIFVIGHIFLFKFNGGKPHAYVPGTENSAHPVIDLYLAVVGAFKQIGFTAFTVVIMALLGFHLRHGFWSSFQSLGWANDKYLPLLEKIALVFAVLMAFGFIIIPVIIYFDGSIHAMAAQNSIGGH